MQGLVYNRDRTPRTGLLFPSELGTMRTDVRKLWDRIAKRAGLASGSLCSKQRRHTFISARLQTLDGATPVALYTVAREVGHSITDMIEQTYAHLGQIRHRSEHVEFRVEQHRALLRERLAALGGRQETKVEEFAVKV